MRGRGIHVGPIFSHRHIQNFQKFAPLPPALPKSRQLKKKRESQLKSKILIAAAAAAAAAVVVVVVVALAAEPAGS